MSDLTLRSTKGALLTNQEVDDNFSTLNADKYEALDNIQATNLALSGTISHTIDVVSAAGSTASDATSLTSTYNVVSTATAGQGVIVPDATTGLTVTIVNNTNANINVYPQQQDKIDSGNFGIEVVLKAGVTMTMICENTDNWITFLSNPVHVYNVSGIRLA